MPENKITMHTRTEDYVADPDYKRKDGALRPMYRLDKDEIRAIRELLHGRISKTNNILK